MTDRSEAYGDSHITIPPEAMMAAARALFDHQYGGGHGDWAESPEWLRETVTDEARTACLAMLEAWPGMHIHEWQRPWLGGMSGTDITLPLPKENTNAEA